jgi:hypothetical protein
MMEEHETDWRHNKRHCDIVLLDAFAKLVRCKLRHYYYGEAKKEGSMKDFAKT